MINVAFLLLIFFLMTAVIAPRDPVSIEPPKAEGEQSFAGDVALFLEADGTLWKDGKPSQSLGDLTASKVELRVSRNLPGRVLASELQRIRDSGAATIDLVVARP
ncbi:MAG: biopolymer transporter ExbD [Boseongicola sp.]|nr:biopolymer transporter ExbD [Boseongicola sp.]